MCSNRTQRSERHSRYTCTDQRPWRWFVALLSNVLHYLWMVGLAATSLMLWEACLLWVSPGWMSPAWGSSILHPSLGHFAPEFGALQCVVCSSTRVLVSSASAAHWHLISLHQQFFHGWFFSSCNAIALFAEHDFPGHFSILLQTFSAVEDKSGRTIHPRKQKHKAKACMPEQGTIGTCVSQWLFKPNGGTTRTSRSANLIFSFNNVQRYG